MNPIHSVDFNRRIWELWKAHDNERGERLPKFITVPKHKGGLLYLGLNPSLPKSISQAFAAWMLKVGVIDRGMVNPMVNYRQHFRWAGSGLENDYSGELATRSAKVHHHARYYYWRFFSRLNTLARWLGVSVNDYAHVDLLLWIERDSGIVRKQSDEASEFAKQQMALAFKLVCAWEPRLIVCPYGDASDVFGNFYMSEGHQFKFEDTHPKCAKLKVAHMVFPWSAAPVPVFRCADLPGSSRAGMTKADFVEAAKVIASCWWGKATSGCGTQRTVNLKIVSGGQTGADRSALDWAIENRVLYGGWCPKSRKAEDGTIPEKYALKETTENNYRQRTGWNAGDADGTVIFTMRGTLCGGSHLTAIFAEEHHKPCLHLAAPVGIEAAAKRLGQFIADNQIKVLNVAGPRHSEEPEVGTFVKAVLDAAFTAK